MCGIAGIVGRSDPALMEKMLDRLFHRGPDDGHFFADESITLGARRLSIIDVAGGRQPVRNEDESVWALLNGEIYNAHSLREGLVARGHRFRAQVDTEVLVHLYEEEGDDFLDSLRGMFAVALWDRKRRRLLLGRDRLGIKPLYFCEPAGGPLLFASEMKALLCTPEVSRGIDFESLDSYFSFKHVPAPRTIFSDIRCLRPGERLLYEDGKARRETYWRIRYRENDRLTPAEAEHGLRALLEDAVESHMVSDVPIGAYLSGGLDSSSVVAFMCRHSTGPVKTFSLGYEDSFQNKEADIASARRVSQLFRTEHHECIISHREVAEELENIATAFDEPFGGVFSTYFITRLIGRHVKVALSGDGADELFGSYLPHRLAQPIAFFRERFGGDLPRRPLTEEERRGLSPYEDRPEYVAAFAREEDWRWRFRLSVFGGEEKKLLYSPMLQDEMMSSNPEERMREWYEERTTADPLNEALEVECRHILPDQVLAFVDRLSMAHSVEVRPPFLDHHLVEFAATIPGRMKIRAGRVKHVLKNALREVLPAEVVERPKEGFVMPVHQWMAGKMRGFIEETLSPGRLKRHGFFNVPYARDLLDGPVGEVGHSNRLWLLVMFQIWYENYIG